MTPALPAGDAMAARGAGITREGKIWRKTSRLVAATRYGVQNRLARLGGSSSLGGPLSQRGIKVN